MRSHRSGHHRRLLLQVSTAFLLVAPGFSSRGQQFPGQGRANYNWNVPYGLNYNYGFMRYGQGGSAGPSSPGMNTATYGVNGQVTAGIQPGVNPFNQEAVAQAQQLQRQMQALQPRFDVRKKTSRTGRSEPQRADKPPTLETVISPEGMVLWPGKVPSEGALGESKAAADAAIEAAFKEYKASGKASVPTVVEAKERLHSYGRAALDRAARQSRASAQKLLHFLIGLEQSLDSLGGA